MPDDPTILSLLAEQIKTLEKNLNRRLDDTERNMGKRLDKQDETLESIETQTKLTNGRVTMLEKARERTQGALAAYSWVQPAALMLLSVGITILIMVLTGAIK
jgi:guanylate kinase